MSVGVYAADWAIAIAALVYSAHLIRMPPHWIAAGAIGVTGLAILSAVKATRRRDFAR